MYTSRRFVRTAATLLKTGTSAIAPSTPVATAKLVKPHRPPFASKNMTLPATILLLNAAATWFMVGLIWIVQIVHYPLFANVGPDGFARYQQLHQWRITFVVGPVMLVEAASALLLAWYPPPTINPEWILAGIGLVIVIWASTAFLQVPCHAKLESGFDPDAHRRLVQFNWIRTVAWSARGLLVTWWLAGCLPVPP